jgi:polar amino acid transport system substrate-binding protein
VKTFASFRKVFVVVLVIILALATTLSLCACSSTNSSENSNNLKPITIGSDVFPPYNYLDENGQYAGIDVEISKEAFRRIGYEANFVTISWSEKDNLLQKGEIDCIQGCYSMTGREDKYQWAGPYMQSRQVVAVDPNSSIRTLADLEGKTVAVQATTKPESILLNGLNKSAGEIKSLYCVDDKALLYPALSKGYVDAIAAHEETILQYEKDYNITFRILDESLLDVDIGIAFSKDDTSEIAKKLDDALSEMHKDGTLEKIVARYLDDPSKYLGVDAHDR